MNHYRNVRTGNFQMGSIGYVPPGEAGVPTEMIGWGDEIVGWGDEIVGWGDEIVGEPCIGLGDGSAGVGTDADWAAFAGSCSDADCVGFIPLIGAAIAGIAGAVSGGAAAVAASVPAIVSAVGGVSAVAGLVEGGIKTAEGLIKAAKAGDEKALEKLKDLKEKKKRRDRKRAATKKLAEVAIRARKGDLKAQAILNGFSMLNFTPLRKLGIAAKFTNHFRAVPGKQIVDGIERAASPSVTGRMLGEAMKQAKASKSYPKAPPKLQLPMKAMRDAGLARGVAAFRRGAAKAKAIPANKRGKSGYLVQTADGRIVRGRWLPGATR